jgi:hypothetical protein
MGQNLVEDETATPGKSAYITPLVANGHELKHEGLSPLHGFKLYFGR